METITKENMSVKDFIQIVLIESIRNIVITGNHYLGFGPQTQAIELLGAIIEEEEIEGQQQKLQESEFDTRFKSRIRFHNALKLFSNPKYMQFCPESEKSSTYNSDYDLYKNLRCGYAHQMRPTGKISVTTQQESIVDRTTHLETDPLYGNLVIVSEILFQDLEDVCKKVIIMIESGEIKHKKPYGDFLSVINYI